MEVSISLGRVQMFSWFWWLKSTVFPTKRISLWNNTLSVTNSLLHWPFQVFPLVEVQSRILFTFRVYRKSILSVVFRTIVSHKNTMATLDRLNLSEWMVTFRRAFVHTQTGMLLCHPKSYMTNSNSPYMMRQCAFEERIGLVSDLFLIDWKWFALKKLTHWYSLTKSWYFPVHKAESVRGWVFQFWMRRASLNIQ